MTADAPEWTVERLGELARSYQLPLVLHTVVKAGALDVLARGPADVATLASACEVDAGALGRLLDALVAVGILLRDEATYTLPSPLAEALADTGIGGLLDGLKHGAESTDKWYRIDEVLRRGHAEYDDGQDVTRDPRRNERFIRAMHAYAGPSARDLAARLPRDDAQTFLDLGGGPGTFSLALAAAWPDLRATIADLPLTLRITRQVVAESGLGDRVQTREADFYADRACDLGGPYDLVLVSAVIHSEGEEANRELFQRVRTVTRDGGRILVRERLLTEERTGPTRSTMFDVHMLVSTRRGKCYSFAEVAEMLTAAGFREPVLFGDLADGYVVARA